ncbi:MAG: hypothetical protein AB1403_10875 [Candidatus Riflebacteria bacterium]
MKIYIDGQEKELTDTDILQISTGMNRNAIEIIKNLIKRANRAEHQTEVWRKIAIDCQHKLEEQAAL